MRCLAPPTHILLLPPSNLAKLKQRSEGKGSLRLLYIEQSEERSERANMATLHTLPASVFSVWGKQLSEPTSDEEGN